jgi:hypothetical protein
LEDFMVVHRRASYSCALTAAVALIASGCTTPDRPPAPEGQSFVSADPAESAAAGGRPMIMASGNLEFLVANSPLVFLGEVVEQEPFLDQARDLVVTRNLFAIKDVIVGDYAEDTLALNLLGGAIGDRVMRVSHLPQFERGGLYVVFTDPARTTYNPVTADEHGTFRVDPATQAVYGAGGFAVTGIEGSRLLFGAERLAGATADDRSAPAATEAAQPRLSGDVLRVEPTPLVAREPVSYERFAEAVRRIADAR